MGCMYYKRIRTMQFPTEYSVCTNGGIFTGLEWSHLWVFRVTE